MEFVWNNKWKLAAGAGAAYYGLKVAGAFDKKIKGDVALVTGGGSGIGRLMALRLAKEGCSLIIWDINEEAMNKVVEELKALGVTAKGYVVNVADREMIYAKAKQVEQDFGRVDILILNAGIVNGQKLLEADDSRIELTMKINTIALMFITKAFLPGMLKRDHGHVLTVASSAGRVGVPGLVDYCASKFGAVGFDESLRLELRKLGSKVKTTCLCPMYINTGMFDGAELRPKYGFLKPVVNALFGVLEPDYVANEAINAVKRNQPVLVMPTAAYTTTILKGFLPTSMCDQLMEDLGVSSSMDEFKQTRPTPTK